MKLRERQPEYQDKIPTGRNFSKTKILTLVQVHWFVQSDISEVDLLVQPLIFYLHRITVNNLRILEIPVFAVEIFAVHWSVKTLVLLSSTAWNVGGFRPDF